MNRLFGAGVSEPELRRIADRLGGVIAAGAAPAAGDQGAALVLGAIADDAFAAAVRQPFNAYLEAGDGVSDGPRLRSTLAANGLYFWLTTGTAFLVSTTYHFCDGLTARGALSMQRRTDVELALHEAVANALIHGNLGLDSDMRDDFRQYEKFCQLLDDRLREPDARARRVEIAAHWDEATLEVAITDQGAGYEQAAVPPTPGEPGSGLVLHGLGIIHSIAESVTTADDGRSLILRFAR